MNTTLPQDGAPVAASVQAMEKALLEAQIMLEYATLKSIVVPDEVLLILTQSKYVHESKSWDATTETAFWKALQVLSSLISPVSIRSIRSSRTEFGREVYRWLFFGARHKVSYAQLSVRRFRAVGIFVLVGVLILQVFWMIGSSVIRKNQEKTGQLNQLQRQLTMLRSDSVQLSAAAAQAERESLARQITVLNEELETNYNLLVRWQVSWKIAMPPAMLLDTSRKYTEKTGAQTTQSSQRRLASITQSVDFALQVIQMYLLPLLYGILGACAYVLRRLSAEIRQMTFTLEADIGYNLRIQLGSLAGLVISWFVVPENGGDMQNLSIYNLSPLALAFLAGYSIELLFTAMDKLISVFTGKIDTGGTTA